MFCSLQPHELASCQSSLSFTIFWSFPKLISTESMMPSNHLIFCCPLLLLLSIFLSIRIFSNELTLHFRWPRYWNFTFRISSSNEYSGLISFKIDWLDLEVQGTLKSLLQHHISKECQKSIKPLIFKHWILKNWCFWTVVLEKTLKNPLESKEIKPVHPKGNLPWIYIGRLRLKLLRSTDSLEKTLMLWKTESRRRGRQRMRWLDGTTD